VAPWGRYSDITARQGGRDELPVEPVDPLLALLCRSEADAPVDHLAKRLARHRHVRSQEPVELVTTLYGVNSLMQNSSSDGTQWLPMFA
jgi:hypothetical protein